MVNTNETNPANMINGYVWALLQQELGLTKINNLTPIKTADAPELRASQKPYLVYAFTEEPHGTIGPLHRGVLTYAVYAKTANEVNNIIHVISRAMGADQSVEWIRQWANNTPFLGMNLAFVDVYGSEAALPANEEGGYVAGFVEVGYRYTVADKDFSIRP